MYLLIDHEIFDILIAEILAVQYIHGIIIGRNHILASLLSIIIYNQVVGYPRNPCRKFTRFGITPLLYGHDSLYKGLLEKIVSYIAVFHYRINIGKHTRLMTFQ